MKKNRQEKRLKKGLAKQNKVPKLGNSAYTKRMISAQGNRGFRDLEGL